MSPPGLGLSLSLGWCPIPGLGLPLVPCSWLGSSCPGPCSSWPPRSCQPTQYPDSRVERGNKVATGTFSGIVKVPNTRCSCRRSSLPPCSPGEASCGTVLRLQPSGSALCLAELKPELSRFCLPMNPIREDRVVGKERLALETSSPPLPPAVPSSSPLSDGGGKRKIRGGLPPSLPPFWEVGRTNYISQHARRRGAILPRRSAGQFGQIVVAVS
ncbi:hypothetical protein QYF61_015818 [Mycteria americana]|uniref:Uncharacterized protein n=1 Tax=Mycteria americana TaxID=33587 RepID=A0AAN7ND45_MYCAM|nr:hypothetical protein QYF61_015818 [Mycteria americana]